MSFNIQNEITALIRKVLATELGKKIQEHNALEKQMLETKEKESSIEHDFHAIEARYDAVFEDLICDRDWNTLVSLVQALQISKGNVANSEEEFHADDTFKVLETL